jgi:hypothetical protein
MSKMWLTTDHSTGYRNPAQTKQPPQIQPKDPRDRENMEQDRLVQGAEASRQDEPSGTHI